MEERIKKPLIDLFAAGRLQGKEAVDAETWTREIDMAYEAILTAVAESQVNRFEVIDHTGEGRVFTKWVEEPFNVKLSHQDDGRTLKVFLAQLGKEEK